MTATVVKWGNGQGIRLPKQVLLECNIEINDTLTLEIIDGKIILSKPFRHKSLEERAKAYGEKLGPYGSFDWEEPAGREVW